MGTLEQIPDFHETTSVLDEALRSSADLIAAEKELQALEHEMPTRPIPNSWTATPRFSMSLNTRADIAFAL